jgi:hypothetical protein
VGAPLKRERGTEDEKYGYRILRLFFFSSFLLLPLTLFFGDRIIDESRKKTGLKYLKLPAKVRTHIPPISFYLYRV